MVGYLNIAASLNLKPDDVLFIGSDLTRLAMSCVKQGETFDVNKFIDSFLTQLPQGTLVIPTYTDHLTNGATFNRQKSRPNIGALPVAAFKRKDAIRTSDPFHSMAVWGKHATLFESITERHTFGKDSAFGVLHLLKAKMLMIDVSFDRSFTFVHYCEEQAQVRWRKMVKHRLKIIDGIGEGQWMDFWFYSRKAGFVNSFAPLESVFEEEKLTQIFLFNDIPMKLLDLSRAYDRILQDIYSNQGANIHKFSICQWFMAKGRKIKQQLVQIK